MSSPSTAKTATSAPQYMKRYFWRLSGFMLAYMGALVGGLSLAKTGISTEVAVLLALVTAAPIIGVFWAIFRLIAECDDEYQRLLLVKQTLLGTALTLVLATVWQFLKVYDVLASGPEWIGAIWFAMWGIGGAIVRRRA